MPDHVFYQHGDEPDAASFAQAFGASTLDSYIADGLGFRNVDFTNLLFDVAAGVASIARGEMLTASPNIDPNELRAFSANPVEIAERTGLSLTDNTVNYVFLDANTGTDDSPLIEVNTSGSAPSQASFKIGEVDTNNDEYTDHWRYIAQDGTLTFPDVDAADEVAAELRAGTVIYARQEETHYKVN